MKPSTLLLYCEEDLVRLFSSGADEDLSISPPSHKILRATTFLPQDVGRCQAQILSVL